MHRKHTACRQQEIQNRECGFLHLSGVAGSANAHHPLLEIDRDAGLGASAIFRRNRQEIGSEENGEFRLVIASGSRLWPDEELTGKKVVPRELAHHTDG